MKSLWPAIFKKPIYEILTSDAQVKAWQIANRKMKWGIGREAFEALEKMPELYDTDRSDGFSSVILSYGFGDDGGGHSDAVLSGRMAWEYAQKYRRFKCWQCEYIDFAKISHFRIRPSAPARPKGFYYAKYRAG